MLHRLSFVARKAEEHGIWCKLESFSLLRGSDPTHVIEWTVGDKPHLATASLTSGIQYEGRETRDWKTLLAWILLSRGPIDHTVWMGI